MSNLTIQRQQVNLHVDFQTAANRLDQDVSAGSSLVMPPTKESHQIKKDWFSAKWEQLSSSKATRTDNKIRRGLEGLHNAAGDLLTSLTALSRQTPPPNMSAKMMYSHAMSSAPEFNKLIGNLKDAAAPATARGVAFDAAFQARVENHVKTASVDNLQVLSEMLDQVDMAGSAHRKELGTIKDAVSQQLASRLDTLANKVCQDINKAVGVLNGSVSGQVLGSVKAFNVVDDKSRVDAFKGLVMGVYQKTIELGNEKLVSAMLARAFGSGTDAERGALMSGIQQHCPENISMLARAASGENLVSSVDPKGNALQAKGHVKEMINSYVSAQMSILADYSADVLNGFGYTAEEASTAPMNPADHGTDLLKGIAKYHQQLLQYDKAMSDTKSAPPNDYAEFKDFMVGRFTSLVSQANVSSETLGSLTSGELAQLEKALGDFGMLDDSMQKAIDDTQLSKRKDLENSYNDKLQSALTAGINGSAGSMVLGLVGFIDLRSKTTPECVALASDVKFANHVDKRGRDIDLLGVFNDPDLNGVVRTNYARTALTTPSQMSVDDMKSLQAQIRKLGPLIVGLQTGAPGVAGPDKGWGRNIADWLQSLDRVASEYTGDAPYDSKDDQMRLVAAGPNPQTYFAALPDELKSIYADALGYSIDANGFAAPNAALPFSDILASLGNG